MQCSLWQVMANPWARVWDGQNQSLMPEKTSGNTSLIKLFLAVCSSRLQAEADQACSGLSSLNFTLLVDEKLNP